jgi:hypothetical protein
MDPRTVVLLMLAIRTLSFSVDSLSGGKDDGRGLANDCISMGRFCPGPSNERYYAEILDAL